MKPFTPKMPTSQTLFVGIDWADKEHALCIFDPDGECTHATLTHEPKAISEWVENLKLQFPDCEICIAIEQSRGALVHALMDFDALTLYPINPKQLANFRTALNPSGKKDDPTDAELLTMFLKNHQPQLRPWVPDSPAMREIALLTELRRKTVDSRKSLVQQLKSCLKLYFPLALNLYGNDLSHPLLLDLLKRWPTLAQLKQVHPRTLRAFLNDHRIKNEERQTTLIETIRSAVPLTRDQAIIKPQAMYVVMLVEQIRVLNKAIKQSDEEISEKFSQHPDEQLFRNLPGAGAAMAPRLMAAFGDDRERYQAAEEIGAHSGIAPITRSSGKYHSVKKRNACNKFLRQTFHEFAGHARKWSIWSQAFYNMKKTSGMKHHAILRALAYKWIRIIFHLWKNKKTYDESHYIAQLKRNNSPIIKFLETT